MKQFALMNITFVLLCSMNHVAQAQCNWPEWSHFKQHFINENGRVIDPDGSKTTSEGQAYSLLFALIANDQTTFAKLLNWTQDNLAHGDLTAHLPAWLWGKTPNADQWEIQDKNSASDADVWMSYALLEAGRLWKKPQYTALGQTLLARIIREETIVPAKLGRTLLPGAYGFVAEDSSIKLNPSYLPIPVLRRIAQALPSAEGQALLKSSQAILINSAPKGFAPDWVRYTATGEFSNNQEKLEKGSFDAIRVYLWAGITSPKDPLFKTLHTQYRPMAEYVMQKGHPPLETNSQTGQATGTGPAGFSAALLPFLQPYPAVQNLQLQRIIAQDRLQRTDNYYEQVLALFGLGWQAGYYRFEPNGMLKLTKACSTS